MGLKICLARAGAKKRPYYHIVIADSRSPARRPLHRAGRQLQPDAARRTHRSRSPADRTPGALDWQWRRGNRACGEIPGQGRSDADAKMERAATSVRAEEEGAGARQVRRGRCGLRPAVPASRIQLGVIGRAHGVRGLVKVTSHTADPADLTAYGPLSDAEGRQLTLSWKAEGVAEITRYVDGVPVKVADRTQAEKLTNTRLFIDRSALPPADEEEFYLADLVGLAAVSETGGLLGTVAVVHDYGAGTSLEIASQAGAPIIVPFTAACVPTVDIAGGRLVIRPPDEVIVPPEAEEAA